MKIVSDYIQLYKVQLTRTPRRSVRSESPFNARLDDQVIKGCIAAEFSLLVRI